MGGAGSGRKAKDADDGEAPQTVQRQILEDLREKLSSGGSVGFQLRVMKKMPGAGYFYQGQMDGSVDDIEAEILERWKDGRYRVYAHYNDNKRVPNIPPMDFLVGQPEDEDPAERRYGGARGASNAKRVVELEEEIEATRKQRELLRAQKELEKMQREAEMAGGASPDVMAKIAAMEEMVDDLQHERDELVAKQREDKLMGEIRRLETKLTEKPAVNPEVAALKDQIARLEADKKRTEFDSLRSEIAALKTELTSGNSKPKQRDMLDYAPLIAAFSPLVSSYIDSNKAAQTQMFDAVTKVGTMLKDAAGKGTDLKEILAIATPLITPLLSHKNNDVSAILGLVGSLVTPMVEAAAEAAAHPPDPNDLGSSIQRLMGLIGKAMDDGKQISGQQAAAAQAQAQAAMAQAQRQPRRLDQQRPRPEQRRAQAPRPEQRSNETPLTRFANRVGRGITDQKSHEKYVTIATRDLSNAEVSHLMSFKDGAKLASYFGSLPGVDSEPFNAPYAKRWLNKFLDELGGPDEPSTPAVPSVPEPEHEPAPKPRPQSVAPKQETVKPAPATMEVDPYDETPQQPESGEDEFKDEPPPNIKANEFKYPPDSKLSKMKVDGLDVTVEYPTPETIAKREEERKAMEAQFKALAALAAAPAPANGKTVEPVLATATVTATEKKE